MYGYLVYILNSDIESPQLKEIPMVKEFIDVFFKKLPRLPLERDEEEFINIFP